MSEISNTRSPRKGTLSYPGAIPKEDVKIKANSVAGLNREIKKSAPLLDPSRNRVGPPRREDAIARMNSKRQLADAIVARDVVNASKRDLEFGFGEGGGGGGGGGGLVGEEPCTDCAAKAAAKSDNTMLYLLAAFLLLGGVG